MQKRILNHLLQDNRQMKKLHTYRQSQQTDTFPILIRNKSCECLECGGGIIKQLEEYQQGQVIESKLVPKLIAQHEKIKQSYISQSHELKITKNLLYLITPKKTVQNISITEQPLISPTLEQPKRDIQKLHRLIEKYDGKVESNVQQICKTMPDAVPIPKQRVQIQRQKTKQYSFIRLLPLEDDAEYQNINYANSSNSQQRTPLRAQVYKELKGSTLLQQLQTPMFQKSKFNKNQIIDFEDGMRKAMEKIKEMDEVSNASKMISTQINDENKTKSRGSLLLKSFLDCTRQIDRDPKIIRQLDVFLRPVSRQQRQNQQSRTFSYQNVYLPKVNKK
ncbi:unnamed protein product (macronuclear) [Paramecium tetraurelia]|uniref:Uncharacterized protein n=1 Tax=Paramecium tetraurelia TaxID=5888 RepID=A0CNA8_PARTE|nr:uncharacterized protein GSPATT00008716001 [Paramecium tetraurelia]CAK72275.1 unnamed protein product [Paramecium tetraurelia]|eukprot:XP_001439672.1 hypothetical protein (macronuclear) [Paramecium tetraurelia strain d4-2]